MADDGQKFLVRDAAGNVYGPATAEMLTQWVRDGRIVPGMGIAPRETREWVDAAEHPATAEAIRTRVVELQNARPTVDAGVAGQGGSLTGDVPVGNPTVDADLSQAVREVQPFVATPSGVAATPVYPVPAARSDGYLQYDRPVRQNGLGLASFICGTIGFATSCLACFCVTYPFTMLLALTAITLGTIGMWQVQNNPGAYRGTGLALGGVILGALSILASTGVVVWVFFIPHHP